MVRVSGRLGSSECSASEPGEVAVPVNGVLAGDRKGRDAAGGEAEGAFLRHDGPRRVPGPGPTESEACNQAANVRHQFVGVSEGMSGVNARG